MRVVVADFVLVYTVLRRDVACRMECSRLRPGDQIWRLFIGSVHYISHIFSVTARRKEIGKLWHCSKEWARNTHLRVEISILKYCFIVELFEKWRLVFPPSALGRLILATHLGRFGDSVCRLSTWGVAQFGRHTGEGGLGWPLAGFPHTQGICFLSRSP